jgi:hypothetical protein
MAWGGCDLYVLAFQLRDGLPSALSSTRRRQSWPASGPYPPCRSRQQEWVSGTGLWCGPFLALGCPSMRFQRGLRVHSQVVETGRMSRAEC